MDVAAMSVVSNNAKIGDAVSIAVLKKAMDVQETMSDGITQMLGQVSNTMERSVQPNLGGNVDYRV